MKKLLTLRIKPIELTAVIEYMLRYVYSHFKPNAFNSKVSRVSNGGKCDELS